MTNFTGNSVPVIDGSTGGVIKTITEADGIGILPLGVVVSPDGALVYVANNGVTNTISVIDAATDTVQPPAISIGGVSGAGPAGLVINPAGSVLYATKLAGNIVAVIDTATRAVTQTIPVGTHPAGIAISHDGAHLYVANLGIGTEVGTVSVIDTATKAVTTIPVGTTPEGIDVGRGGKKVYVANNGSNNVSVIDTASNKVAFTIPLGACAPEGLGTFIREGFTAHPVHH